MFTKGIVTFNNRMAVLQVLVKAQNRVQSRKNMRSLIRLLNLTNKTNQGRRANFYAKRFKYFFLFKSQDSLCKHS